MAEHLIIVEDDLTTRNLLAFVLSQAGYRVSAFDDGEDALAAADGDRPDLVIVDLGLPHMSGRELIAAMRAAPARRDVPVLVLTASDVSADKYAAFDLGARDYVTKPFDPQELLYRIRALLRYGQSPATQMPSAIEAGGVRLEPRRFTAHVEGREVQLSRLETAVLEHLMRHPDQVFSARRLADEVLAAGEDGGRSVDAAQAHVRHLRQKLEADPSQPRLIVTVGRQGYRFNG